MHWENIVRATRTAIESATSHSDITTAVVRNGEVEKVLLTQRKAAAAEAVGKSVRSSNFLTTREEEAASTCITRPLEFDPEMSRVAYAAGLSMLGVLVLSTFCTAGVVNDAGGVQPGQYQHAQHREPCCIGNLRQYQHAQHRQR
jgi:hypothetical protein